MGATRCDFGLRSGSLALAARASGAALAWQEIFAQPASGDWWRLPTFTTLTGAPFAARLTWSCGGSASWLAYLTVARGTRTSVFARELKIEVANLVNAENKVTVGVPDGHAETENQWEVVGEQSVVEVAVDIPPFAKRVRVDLETTGAYATSMVRLVDGYSATRALMAVADQPPQGLLLGGAASMLVLPTARYRAVFTLHL